MIRFGAMNDVAGRVSNVKLSAGVLRALLSERVTVNPKMSKDDLVSLATVVWGATVLQSTADSAERKLRGSR